jgi:hypothetical protein
MDIGTTYILINIGDNGFYAQARADWTGWVLLGLLLYAFAIFGK